MDANPSTVSRWVNGNPLSKTSLKRFLMVTGAAENFLITGQEPMFEPEPIEEQLYPEASLPGYHAPNRDEQAAAGASGDTLAHGEMHALLGKICNSGHKTLIRAIAANLLAFSEAIDNKAETATTVQLMKQMEDRMNKERAAFEQRLQKLEERLGEGVVAPKQVANG